MSPQTTAAISTLLTPTHLSEKQIRQIIDITGQPKSNILYVSQSVPALLEPRTLEDAKAATISDFLSKEEQEGAKEKWKALSTGSIESFTKFSQIHGLIPSCNLSTPSVIIGLYRKAVVLHKTHYDLVFLLDSFQNGRIMRATKHAFAIIKREILQQLLLFAKKDLGSSIELWPHFSGHSAEKQLLEITSRQLCVLNNAKPAQIESVFDSLKFGHALGFEIHELWKKALSNNMKHAESRLTCLHERHEQTKKRLEALKELEKSFDEKETLRRRGLCKLLEIVLTDLEAEMSLIVSEICAETPLSNRETLIQKFLFVKRGKIPEAEHSCVERLGCAWNLTLRKRQSEVTFDQLLALYNETSLVAGYLAQSDRRPIEALQQRTWNKLRRHMTTAARCKSVLEAAAQATHRDTAAKLWLESKPGFSEIMAMLDGKYDFLVSPVLLEALLDAASNHADRIKIATQLRLTDFSARAFGYFATRVSKISEALELIEATFAWRRSDGERAPLIRSTLRFVSSEIELRGLSQLIHQDHIGLETRLLIEKAIEVVGTRETVVA